jgi:hypothetical protein
MSSIEFPTIYNNAASIIAIRLSDFEGVATVLDDLRSRLRTDTHDPLENRELVLEPELLSQQLRVPAATVEAVISELRRFNFVHIWVRAECPNVPSDDDNVIVETNSVEAFRQSLRDPCGHCGQYHEALDWDSLKTFYALHFDGRADSFLLRRFFIPKRKLEAKGQPPPTRRLAWLLNRAKRFFAWRARMPVAETPAEAVATQLSLNQPNSRVPSSGEMAWRLVQLLVAFSITIPIAFLICRWISGILIAAVVTLILIFLVWLATWVMLTYILSIGFVRRTLLSSGFIFSGGLFASSVEFQAHAGEKIPWEVKAGWGEVSVPLASLAVIAFLITCITLIAYEWVTGWFSQKT